MCKFFLLLIISAPLALNAQDYPLLKDDRSKKQPDVERLLNQSSHYKTIGYISMVANCVYYVQRYRTIHTPGRNIDVEQSVDRLNRSFSIIAGVSTLVFLVGTTKHIEATKLIHRQNISITTNNGLGIAYHF